MTEPLKVGQIVQHELQGVSHIAIDQKIGKGMVEVYVDTFQKRLCFEGLSKEIKNLPEIQESLYKRAFDLGTHTLLRLIL